MTTLYVVGNHELDYDDECYTIQNGMTPIQAFTERSEAEINCREMNTQYLKEFGEPPLQSFDENYAQIAHKNTVHLVFEALRTHYGDRGLETLLNLDPGELCGLVRPETYRQVEEMRWDKLPDSLVGKLVDLLGFSIYYIQEVPLGE